ncbi:hypothetical protein NDU88_000139 [Pleurodeles waltl]|uniref:Uncharacterized protein n=1 Tax=Pleurodeles waltl TaxID=8319 RepID=A0AAV7KP45_PLEWA|nr:hypothetical protein NDU88_000139 [Pleurodeles waltl]
MLSDLLINRIMEGAVSVPGLPWMSAHARCAASSGGVLEVPRLPAAGYQALRLGDPLRRAARGHFGRGKQDLGTSVFCPFLCHGFSPWHRLVLALMGLKPRAPVTQLCPWERA